MVSARSLLGRRVLVRRPPETIGTVKGLCLDPIQGRVCAVFVAPGGLFRTQSLLYWQDVDLIEADALWVAGKNVLDDPKTVPAHWWTTQRVPGIWGRDIQDQAGKSIGSISDVIMDRTGRIVACQISDGIVMDFLQGRYTLMTTVTAADDGESLQAALPIMYADCMKPGTAGTLRNVWRQEDTE